jgi:hypothetical protein
MPEVGFEPTIPVSERAKTFRALDRAASVISIVIELNFNSYLPIRTATLHKMFSSALNELKCTPRQQRSHYKLRISAVFKFA